MLYPKMSSGSHASSHVKVADLEDLSMYTLNGLIPAKCLCNLVLISNKYI